MVQVMITEGTNVHSPEYHSEITAGKIIAVAESASEDKVRAARDVRRKIEDVLLAHHKAVHADEQKYIKDHGPDVEMECTTSEYDQSCMDVYTAILNASRNTVLFPHFQRQEVRDAILAELHHETRSQMQVHHVVAEALDTKGARR